MVRTAARVRTSPSRGSQPVPLGQADYKITRRRVRLSTGEVVESWTQELPNQPVGEPIVVGASTWQFVAEKLADSIRLSVVRLRTSTGEIVSTTPLPLSARTTLEEAQELSDTELGVVPTHDSTTFSNDYENGDGVLENGGYLKGFLVWREDPQDTASAAYVIPRLSRSPQIVCWKLTETTPALQWTLAGDSDLPTEYRHYSSVILDPRPGQKRLLLHWESWAWQSASNLFTDHIPNDDNKNYLCGFRDYETALPILPGALCQPEDTADFDGWVRDEGDTSYAVGFHDEYLAGIDNTRDHFAGNDGPGYWSTISTNKAPRWHRHGYRVVDPTSGGFVVERTIKIHSGEATVPGGPLSVESYRSEWVPPETDPHDVVSSNGFVVQKPGDGIYDATLKRGYVDQLDDDDSLYLFKEFIIWTTSVNPTDDPETLTWFVNYGVSSPSLYSLDITRYSHWTLGAPSLHGNPQNFSTADTGVTFPWRRWVSLLIKTATVHWTQDASYRVPWHTCEAVCSGDRIIFRARGWEGGGWRESSDTDDFDFETGVDQIASASGQRPESYPLAVFDWSLGYNPDSSGLNAQSSTYLSDASMQKQYFADDVSARTNSNSIVHGIAPGESGSPAVTWWAERVATVTTTGGEIILDENGDPVLDENGDPTFYPEETVNETHLQVWAADASQALRLGYSELTGDTPGDVSGTAQQDTMIYQLTDLIATGTTEEGGQVLETYPLKSVIVVTEEGFVNVHSPAGAVWVGLIDNPASGTRVAS